MFCVAFFSAGSPALYCPERGGPRAVPARKDGRAGRASAHQPPRTALFLAPPPPEDSHES